MAVADPRTRLGAAVEDRIDELGLEYVEVAARAGISVETLAKVRRGEKVRDTTLRKIEQALGWPRGHMEQVLSEKGADPLAAPAERADEEEVDAKGLLREGERLTRLPSGDDEWEYTLWLPAPAGRRRRLPISFPRDAPLEEVVSELHRLAELIRLSAPGHTGAQRQL
ncbi:helix-turn-helix domain-containing protein [Nocardiopsis composta]|uniref:Transcriptional regulator with XRE-family HTH domain n=1 Tax=Nocardiopsis composta TaxID=157465 RepID=A0A7W8QKD3_9ACTN|nr:helix-turn-helix domain-containing protein [Nocardiopsis composta]MBB5431403.1 transcriptional regulator with XRE-family HTH domain [Nocardiopsis composta]